MSIKCFLDKMAVRVPRGAKIEPLETVGGLTQGSPWVDALGNSGYDYHWVDTKTNNRVSCDITFRQRSHSIMGELHTTFAIFKVNIQRKKPSPPSEWIELLRLDWEAKANTVAI